MALLLSKCLDAGWALTLRCQRRRAGLKSVRPCLAPHALDIRTLIAAFGPDVDLEWLQAHLRCPGCGSDRVDIQFVMHATAGWSRDQERQPRRMRPARGTTTQTLRTTPEEWIVFTCAQCGRRGEIKRETLLREFDPDTPLPSLLAKFAAARGCPLARPDPSQFDLTRPTECKISYDVDLGAETS